ncbi:MAG: PaaI family thioesterase [Nitrospirales bacterium]|nr:PaaI family thioesterase [Nitrospirales bacterium]
MLNLDDDNHCFACGRENPCGLKLSFLREEGKTIADFTPSKIHQGYREITHGGIITTILDEVMIQAAIAEGIFPVTAEIAVRFRLPLMAHEPARAEALLTRKGRRIIEAEARLFRKSDNAVIAEATAKLIPVKQASQ